MTRDHAPVTFTHTSFSIIFSFLIRIYLSKSSVRDEFIRYFTLYSVFFPKFRFAHFSSFFRIFAFLITFLFYLRYSFCSRDFPAFFTYFLSFHSMVDNLTLHFSSRALFFFYYINCSSILFPHDLWLVAGS